MHDAPRTLESAAWAAAEGNATADQLALLEADPRAWRRTLERLLDETEDTLDAVRRLERPERDRVVADFEEELARLEAAYDVLTRVPGHPDGDGAVAVAVDPAGEVRLQASWSAGQVVVWAAAPAVASVSQAGLAPKRSRSASRMRAYGSSW